MFEPASLRINPTFTRLTKGQEAGERVDADVELADALGDSAKGGGGIYFELFQYRPRGVDVRGDRVGEPAYYDLSTQDAQKQYWQNVSRTYRFRLPWPELDAKGGYVLSATYEPLPGQGGERLFDRLVLRPQRDAAP